MMFYVGGVTLLMLRGLRRFWKQNSREAVPYFILLSFFPLAYYLSLALIDHRSPIEPVIVIVAVAGAIPFRSVKSKAGLAGKTATPSSI